jgi:tetratricopeptide (TPR) repeat protein
MSAERSSGPMQLSMTDQKLLEYAQGWAELGLPLEAHEELDRITPTVRGHPDVIMVRYLIYASAKKWEMAAELAEIICNVVPQDPAGFIKLALALHELNRTDRARDVLLAIADKFPANTEIPYDLARYCCRLGERKVAWQWLRRAIDLSNSAEMKLRALEDPTLQELLINTADL